MAAITDYTLDAATKAYVEAAGKGKPVTVEIGDVKDASAFQPQVKLKCWDNECNVSFRLAATDADKKAATVTEKDGLIKWLSDKVEAHFYAKAADAANERGAYEFEIVLKEAPASNVLNLTLNVPKELEFHYQGELTQDEIDMGAVRPENVVGSYAVYHASRGNVHAGADGEKYKTGKAFHIYRPWAIDAKGRSTWCDLHIDTETGIASIAIPQKWLDAAAYPVLIDPTFGYTSVGGSAALTSANNIYTCGDSYTGAAGTGASMSLYAAKEASNATVQMAIYNGTSLVSNGYTAAVTVNATGQWWAASFATGPALSATGYYLAMNGNAAVYLAYDSTATNDLKYAAQAYGSWPSSVTWSTLSVKYTFSIYVTTGVVKSAAATVSATTAISAVPNRVRAAAAAIEAVTSIDATAGRIRDAAVAIAVTTAITATASSGAGPAESAPIQAIGSKLKIMPPDLHSPWPTGLQIAMSEDGVTWGAWADATYHDTLDITYQGYFKLGTTAVGAVRYLNYKTVAEMTALGMTTRKTGEVATA